MANYHDEAWKRFAKAVQATKTKPENRAWLKPKGATLYSVNRTNAPKR